MQGQCVFFFPIIELDFSVEPEALLCQHLRDTVCHTHSQPAAGFTRKSLTRNSGSLMTFLGVAQLGRTQAQVVAREGQSVGPLRLQLATNSLNLQQAYGT